MRTEILDVVVVGAGQAGLATGYFLKQTPLAFRLFDHAGRVGDSWRRRYDSLMLFSPRAYSSLPGLPIDGDPGGYADKNEIADYLERYAMTLDLPLTMGDGIVRLEHADRGFVALTGSGQRVAAHVAIVATGAFQRSIVPRFATRLPGRTMQLAADAYRHRAQVPQGRVLIVGGGATGRQIAHELAPTHQVSLSVGGRIAITPQRVLGRDVMQWFDRLGFLRADKDSPKGRFARAHESFPGRYLRSRALSRRGVGLGPRIVDAGVEGCYFADGSAAAFDAVIWAVGYRDDSSWLLVPGTVDREGNYVQERGLTTVPGLFHVGRSWQTSRASALLCGVGADAEEIVRRACDWLARSQVTSCRTFSELPL
jgi:putative flavoprotein involved in K+ transport